MVGLLRARALQGIVTVLAVSVIVFLFVNLSGDPTAMLIPADAPPEATQMIRSKLGLDRPLYEQYFKFMGNFWRGDVVQSLRYREPVLPLVLSHLQWTLVLAGGSMAIAFLLAVPLGVITALKRGGIVDVGIRVVAVFGQSMPSFWVGMLLMLFVAVKLGLLPVSGLGVKHAILPMATLAFFQVAVLLRLVRSEMLEVMNQDYIRTARSKGLQELIIIGRHALKNALIPIVTVMGLQVSALVLGAVVVEPIFAWPGLGWLMLESVFARDFPVVVGAALVAAVLVTAVNLTVDVLYGVLDPRVRVE